MTRYDLVCIGGGPAGQKAAIQAGKIGKKVALIDSGERLGGVSVHSGTVPSKTIQEISRFLYRLKNESRQGLRIHAPANLSIQQILSRSRIVVHVEEDLAEDQLERNHVEVIRGTGRLDGPHRVAWKGPEGEGVIEGEYIVLATGSRPRRPKGIPYEDQVLYDSNGVMQLRKLPSKLVVVGAGIIGCEYATIFANLGVQVDLFDIADAVIGWADREISETLTNCMRLSGVRIHLNDTITSYEKKDGMLRVISQQGKILDVDQALISKGREGNVEHLGLDTVGLAATDRGTVKVDEHYRTEVPYIYAAGDIIGHPALSSTSMWQGMYLARHIFLGEEPRFTRSDMPIGIWTVPEVAMIGPTEQDLIAKGVKYGVGRSDFQENTRSQITGETRGILKLLFELDSRRLLGVHIVSEKATELLALGQAVVHLGGTVDYFIDQIFNYPTLSGV
ncbi:MAG: Si-specific NAD(P)(+) transhydrogenase, partial [Spirochaetia bacterium]|nr:Si-specific NAD(P)(+) transhydrogenase [Spirochaetia bacterium]